MSESAEPQLYQSRIPIHPRSIKGKFRTFKTGVLVLAYAVFFLLPWLRWDRPVGANQAILFDIPERRFYLFDMVIHPQDMYWLAVLLIIAAWLLFFVTGLVGRAFCGYFCFQTLWTDLFMFVERWVQGDRPARMRLLKAPWNGEKTTKIGLTWLIWFLIAVWSGFTFTAYWVDAPTLFVEFFTLQAPTPAYITTGLLTLTTFVMAGLAREQVCIYMCPYSRFQTVMFDKETLLVSYDYPRGEAEKGRAHLGKGLKTQEERHAAGVGDCIDCGLCVQVCPTGIDIRKGLQIACISCGLCIDACDEIMAKQGWPKGLIRYASETEIETGKKPSLLKFRTIGYGVALTAAFIGLTYGVLSRTPVEFSVNQVRQPLFVSLADGRVQNSYELKIQNKTMNELDMALSVEGLDGVEIEYGGNVSQMKVPAEGHRNFLVRLKMPAQNATGQQPFRFVIHDKGGALGQFERTAMFNSPNR
ncbi:MAG: cytochrome c oxidase accessory protein CcoG [Halothiobacillaceae bacterium]|nr:cytochrome c oxidase accessory protein CcoG [Halothiobacillaceae bacterium]